MDAALKLIIKRFHHPSDHIANQLIDGHPLLDYVELDTSDDDMFLSSLPNIPHPKRLELRNISQWYTFQLKDDRYGLLNVPNVSLPTKKYYPIAVMVFNHDAGTYQLYSPITEMRIGYRRSMMERTTFKFDKTQIVKTTRTKGY